jgi:hypothetical protein
MRHSLWWDYRLRWWDWHMEPIRTWLPRFMTPVPTSDPQINTHYTFLLLIIRKKLGKGVIWQWLIGRLIGIILETGKANGNYSMRDNFFFIDRYDAFYLVRAFKETTFWRQCAFTRKSIEIWNCLFSLTILLIWKEQTSPCQSALLE